MATRSEWQVSKTEVVSNDGVVATMYPQATEAGAEMLRRGGNAIDAAVAAAFTLGVVEPFNSGLGGIAVLVYHESRTGKTYVVDGTGILPLSIRPDQFPLAGTDEPVGIYGWPAVVDDANNTGYLTPATPGMPACLCTALEQFGTMPRKVVIEDAIALAARGFPVDWYVALGMAVNQSRLQQFPESRRTFLRPDGTCYRAPMLGVEGDHFRQPDLAHTLTLIAEHGGDVFYRGEIAERIDREMAANGGLLSGDDLTAYSARVEAGIIGEYRGHQVIGGLDNTGFPTVMQALKLLDGFDLASLEPGGADELHLVAEAQRLAFVDRFAHLGDASTVPVPLQGLLSEHYAAERRARIDLANARLGAEAGDPWRHDPGRTRHHLAPAVGAEEHTTHLTVVDRDHNLVTLTSTLGLHFGSAVVVPGTGIVLNNGTMWFNPVPGSINSIAPGRRGMTAAAPTIVLREGRPFLAVGAPGGRRVISSVIHSIVNVVDHGFGPQDAVTAPRLHCESDETIVDVRSGEARIDELRRRGHNVTVKEETFSTTYFGRPNAVVVDDRTGELRGGVNQYKPTLAIGL